MGAPLIYGIQGIAQLGLGAVNAFQANKQLQAAQEEYQEALQKYRSQDTSNLYANMQNPYEDLTVNQQQFRLQEEGMQRGLADTMASLRQTAGSSGIAAFAQSLANQQARNYAAMSAQIGQQEARNIGLAAQGASRIQELGLAGAAQSRAMESSMASTELGMSMNQLAAANMARNAAYNQMAGGVGNIAAGGVELFNNLNE